MGRLIPPDSLQVDEAGMRRMLDGIRAEAAYAGVTGATRIGRRVLDALAAVPRHCFVPDGLREDAYADRPLPIGNGQTISQPFVVALMTELLQLGPESVVLEIGTGSGYQTAVLAQLARRVFSIERLESLATAAAERLFSLGYRNVETRVGDGYAGWPEHAPYDGIIVTAAVESLPPRLLEQLKPAGRLVIPVGPAGHQSLQLITCGAGGDPRVREVLPVAFVPLVHEREPQEGA